MHIREAGPTDAAALARVHVCSSRAAYRGILPDHYLAAFSCAVQEKFFADLLRKKEIFCYAAEQPSAEVVGFAAGCRERTGHPVYQGELYAVYILPQYQRRGIGRLLVQRVAQRFYETGVSAMRVWVLAENAALDFYRLLGAQQIESRLIEIGGRRTEEVSFGWRDIRHLVLLSRGLS